MRKLGRALVGVLLVGGGLSVWACSSDTTSTPAATREIPGVASLEVPEGALAPGSTVELTAGPSPEDEALLSDTTTPFGAKALSPTFVVVKTSALPERPIRLTLDVPNPVTTEEAFVVIRQLHSSELEEIPSFESEVSTIDGRRLVVELAPIHFRTVSSGAMATIALITRSRTEGTTSQGLRIANHGAALEGDPCPAGGFSPPLEDARVTSDFGERPNPKTGTGHSQHYGVDYSAAENTPVLAMADGVISLTSEQKVGWGKFVAVKHGKKGTTVYAHLSNNGVLKPGKSVKKGDVIGYSGSTGGGNLTGPHLHVEYAWDGDLRKAHSAWSKTDPRRCMQDEDDAGDLDAGADANVDVDGGDGGPSDAGPDASDGGPGASDGGPDASDGGPDASHCPPGKVWLECPYRINTEPADAGYPYMKRGCFPEGSTCCSNLVTSYSGESYENDLVEIPNTSFCQSIDPSKCNSGLPYAYERVVCAPDETCGPHQVWPAPSGVYACYRSGYVYCGQRSDGVHVHCAPGHSCWHWTTPDGTVSGLSCAP